MNCKTKATTVSAFTEIDIPRTEKKVYLEQNTLGYHIGPSSKSKEEILGRHLEATVRKPQCLGYKESGVVRNVTLEATYACNLNCDYCFVSWDPNNKDNSAFMKTEIAQKFMLQYMPPDQMKDRFIITFFGGEPLMNMRLITEFIPWARERYGRKAGFSLTTNGTLLKEPLAKFLPEGSDAEGSIAQYWSTRGNFLLSMDGPAEVHDAHRPLHGGKGSHATIMESLEHMKEFTPGLARRFRWRPTYCRDIIESNVTYLDRLRYFNDLITSGFGRTTGLGYANEPFDDWDELKYDTYLKDLQEQYCDAAEWFISEVKAGRYPQWTCILGAVSRIYKHQVKLTGCGAGNGLVACGVDGTLYACHRTKGGEIGHLDSGFDMQLTSKWADARYYRRNRCPECDHKNFCGGGCKANSISLEGDILIPDHHACNMVELVLRIAFLIISKLSDSELSMALKRNGK